MRINRNLVRELKEKGVMFCWKGKHRESDKIWYVSVKENLSFLREVKKKPREELGRENPSIFAVEFAVTR